MLDRIEIKGFKAFAETKLTLGRLTGLVGPNGSGKTTILEAIEHLTEVDRREFEELLKGPTGALLVYKRAHVCWLELVGFDGNKGLRFSCKSYDGQAGHHPLVPPSNTRLASPCIKMEKIDHDNNINDWQTLSDSPHGFSGFGASVRLNLDPSTLALPT
jgi:energy-coupling factor transporter ATP-binding protein EcfA2